ncbi:MAG: tetratricopeptide repeat protein, partial [Flavobacteriales bacterium]|nr:tetratricopeptide repeat protein [Flavobacteriales bacterium]
MKANNSHIKYIILAFSLLIIVGCSTEKNTPVNRAYHNVTARYNGYFNAKESINEGVGKLKESHEENYEKILPIYIYGDESAARSVYPQMDRAIEKSSHVINNHSMYIKKVEYCAWVDDSYFLIGKASFYKKDFEKAEEMLIYVANEYKDAPIHYDAMLWLARTYIEDKEFSKARGYIDKCSDEEFPEKKLAELKAVKADFYLKQKNYDAAAKEIKNALEYTKKRKDKTRLTFILAQVYKENGDSKNAIRYYDEVLKLNPEYEMGFYANIHSALAHEGGNSGPIKTKLKEMARDEKYEEFFDQIYYALAELELKENNKQKGIEYLELSYEKSIINDEQKAKSFNRLADIYFDDKDYILAQAYYDSTVAIVDKRRPEYPDILERRNSLTRLVKDILIVNKEDSLQQLATLPKAEQESIVDEIIRKIIQEEEQKKAEEEANALNAQNTTANTKINRGTSTEWYFYNPSTIAFGKAEFKKKWGNRKLEDNWRRKNKSSTASSGFDEDYGELEDLGIEDTNATSRDLKSPRYYLQNIPNNKTKLNSSHNSIIAALYDLGLVYKEKLKDNKQAIVTFEDLVLRYDTSKFHVSTYYQLYRLFSEAGNTTKANQYKNKVLNGFPNSQYAQLIKDPGYLDKEKNQASAASKFYEATYYRYKKGSYMTVISNSNKADSVYKSSELLSKFHYLKAQSIGETDSITVYEAELRSFIENYPETPEAKVAKRTLEYITKGVSSDEEESEDKINYKFKADAKHHVIILLPKEGVDMNKAKIAVSDFNRKYFKAE